MARSVTLTGVPNSDVADIKADYEHQGATVTVTDNGDGTSTVVAVWPDASGVVEAAGAAAGAAATAHAAAAQAHTAAATAHAAAATAAAAAAKG